MSADPTANLQVFSPPGSGRSSPAPRSARHAAEERMSSFWVWDFVQLTVTKQLCTRKTRTSDDMRPVSNALSPSGTLHSRNGPTTYHSWDGC
ncbi:Dopey,N-terminal-domain-containing protein [Alternaria alternata]|nr:Dopey,N-terminal-domain-containing protein [Alternaria alternata]